MFGNKLIYDYLNDILKDVPTTPYRSEERVTSNNDNYIVGGAKYNKNEKSYDFEFPFPGKTKDEISIYIEDDILTVTSLDNEVSFFVTLMDKGIIKELITAKMSEGLLKVNTPFEINAVNKRYDIKVE